MSNRARTPLALYLSPGDYVDSNDPGVAELSRSLRADDQRETLIAMFEFVRELPTNAVGKIDKKVLKALNGAPLEAPVDA